MVHSQRKTRKLRGSRTAGYGNAQKHRGAGHRGGRGLAGSSSHRWVWVTKNLPGHIGKKGFNRKPGLRTVVEVMNVGFLESHLLNLQANGFVQENNGVYTVDLSTAGVDKLLGAGVVSQKMNVTVASATEKAREKVEAAGGSITELHTLSSNEDEGSQSTPPEGE